MSTTTLPLARSKPIRSFFGRIADRHSADHFPTIPLTPPATEARPAPACRKKILLVDDDAVILKTTSLRLQSQGYAVITAMDGAAAIRAVRSEKPDLILLDISFPPDVASGGSVSWDGFLIMSWLRRLGEARDIPFIVITGGDPAKYEARSLATGAMAFFHKPLDHHSLLSLIERTVADRPEAGFDTNFQI